MQPDHSNRCGVARRNGGIESNGRDDHEIERLITVALDVEREAATLGLKAYDDGDTE